MSRRKEEIRERIRKYYEEIHYFLADASASDDTLEKEYAIANALEKLEELRDYLAKVLELLDD